MRKFNNISFKIPNFYSSFSQFDWIMIAGILLIILFLGITAFFAPPNTWDSMTYHMSRVAHWIQNKNVNFYPTNIDRQIFQAPFAEYCILHFQLLSGGDQFANFIQYISMIGSVIGVSLIAKQLGGGIKSQIISAVVCVTIPMGILQASSTQTDYVVSFFLVSFVFFLIKLRDDNSLWYCSAVGVSLGIAILTKQTAWIFSLPFIIWFILSIFHQELFNFIKVIKKWSIPCFIILIIIGIVNGGYFARNILFFGDPIGTSSSAQGVVNEVCSPNTLAVNSIRNIALHLGTVQTFNRVLTSNIYSFTGFLHMNLNDPKISFGNYSLELLPISLNEDTAGNFFAILLFIIVGLTVVIYYNKIKNYSIFRYLILLITCFLLFSLVLKWQPWGSRLQLPFFILSAPLIGVVLNQLWNRKVVTCIVIVLLIASTPWVFINQSRPLLDLRLMIPLTPIISDTMGVKSETISFYLNNHSNILTMDRTDQYFINRPNLKKSYQQCADFVSMQSFSKIGLDIGGDDWEYPFWVLINPNNHNKYQIEHINIDNPTKVLPYPEGKDFEPDAIFSTKNLEKNEIIVGNNHYKKAWNDSYATVFIPS